jgi:hypothetical protein
MKPVEHYKGQKVEKSPHVQSIGLITLFGAHVSFAQFDGEINTGGSRGTTVTFFPTLEAVGRT